MADATACTIRLKFGADNIPTDRRSITSFLTPFRATFAAVLVMGCIASTASTARDLQFSVSAPLAGDPVINRLIKNLKEKNFAVAPNSVAKDSELLASVRNGDTDFAVLPVEAFADSNAEKRSNLAAILSLPFQLSSSSELFTLEDGPFGAAVLNDISDKQLRALALFTKGMSQLAANRAVKSRKDLKKLKVATLGIESDQVLEKLGGQPIQVSTVLAVEYKKQNIDAFEWIPQAAELAPPFDVTLNLGFRPVSLVLVTNAKFWTSLTEAERIDIAASAHDAEARCRAAALRLESIRKRAQEKKEVSYAPVGPEDFARLGKIWKDTFLASAESPVVAAQFELFDKARAEAQRAQKKRAELPISAPATGTLYAQASSEQSNVVHPPTLFATDRIDEFTVDAGRRFGLLSHDADPFTCGVAGEGRRLPNIFSKQTAPIGFSKGLQNCLALIRNSLSKLPSNSVLVYLHGFANTFEYAVRRGLDLSDRLDFPGVVLVWSWPSDGSSSSYFSDRETAELAERAVDQFMSTLVTDLPDTKFYVLAHSMGAQIELSVIERLARDGLSRRVHSFVSVAGDINQDIFFGRFRAVTSSNPTHPTFTNYASDTDTAMNWTEYWSSARRMGSGGDRIFVSNEVPVQSIESSALSGDFFFGHSYILDHRLVVDLNAVFQGLTPDARHLAVKYIRPRPGSSSDDRKYWQFP